MRIAVISDIHANLVALERVLKAMDALGTEALWCLGDVVGYGPQPQACVDLLRERADVCLAGNHDLAVVGAIPLDRFNPVARTAALWQREHLTAEGMAWLASLTPKAQISGITLAHGSPRHPDWEYVDSHEAALANFDAFDTPLCLIGHSHLALGWRMSVTSNNIVVEEVMELPGLPVPLNVEDKWLLNPGSVGQPRDHDPRASFAVLDTKAWRWTWHRVEYDIQAVEEEIIAAGLPEVLGRRLYLGW